jgi:hypothetical protein
MNDRSRPLRVWRIKHCFCFKGWDFSRYHVEICQSASLLGGPGAHMSILWQASHAHNLLKCVKTHPLHATFRGHRGRAGSGLVVFQVLSTTVSLVIKIAPGGGLLFLAFGRGWCEANANHATRFIWLLSLCMCAAQCIKQATTTQRGTQPTSPFTRMREIKHICTHTLAQSSPCASMAFAISSIAFPKLLAQNYD